MSHTVHLLYRGDQSEAPIECDDYVAEFSKNQMLAATIPILAIRYKNIKQLSDLLSNKPTGLIVTSPRVVESISRGLQLLSAEARQATRASFEASLIFVVGKKTGLDCLNKLKLNYNIKSAETGNGRALADYVLEQCGNSFTFTKIDILYPKSSLADTTIESKLTGCQGINLIPLDVYETDVIDNIAQASTEALARMVEPIEEITNLRVNLIFFSPSAVVGFLKQGNFRDKVKTSFPNVAQLRLAYSAIGPTTEAELLKNGLQVFCVAEKPQPGSLVEAISNMITKCDSIIAR